MKVLQVLTVVVVAIINSTNTSPLNDYRILFWNLENFFDSKDGGTGPSDAEFSAHGARHWTRRRYNAKCGAIAKTILWTGEETGRLPEIVAVAEVENRKVLADLTLNTPLRKADYGIVHYDSPDARGIDVALLYRKPVFRLLDSSPLHIPGLTTRDILLCTLVSRTSPEDTLRILVNHHPSKYGGPSSAARRKAAIARLKAACDSLLELGASRIILCGDFNDTPDNPLFDTLGFTNLAAPLALRGEGTIRFSGKWELIDMFFVPPSLADSTTMHILKPPFLLVRDNVHPGEKPFRTWSGPRYQGGVSDHLPILLIF